MDLKEIERRVNMGCLIGALFILFVLLIVGGLSWIITCGLIKLITLCFGLTFSWAIATGIWLILMLIGGGIKITYNSK